LHHSDLMVVLQNEPNFGGSLKSCETKPIRMEGMTWHDERTKDVTAHGVPVRPQWMQRFGDEWNQAEMRSQTRPSDSAVFCTAASGSIFRSSWSNGSHSTGPS